MRVAIIQYNVVSKKETGTWVISCPKQIHYYSNYSIWNPPTYPGTTWFESTSHRFFGQHISAPLPPPFFDCALQPRCSALSNAAQSPWAARKLMQHITIDSWLNKYTTILQNVPTKIANKQTQWCLLCPDGSFPTHFAGAGNAPGSLPVTSCEIWIFCTGMTLSV